MRRNISLNATNLDSLLRDIRNMRSDLSRKSDAVVGQVAEEVRAEAQTNFYRAEYAGDNDVIVSVENTGVGSRTVHADGKAAAFIEFGTGIGHPNSHPDAAENGITHGTYGKGHGAHPPWIYEGNPGTIGHPIGKIKRNGKMRVITSGNNPNMSLYAAGKARKYRLKEVAKEVFKD